MRNLRRLLRREPIAVSEREKKSSTETETAATEQSSKSDSQRPTRDDLINELQTLTEDLGGAPKAPEMDDQGSYSTHEYYREFGSWNDALGAAGDRPKGVAPR